MDYNIPVPSQWPANCKINNLRIIFFTRRNRSSCNVYYYMASSVSGQDEFFIDQACSVKMA